MAFDGAFLYKMSQELKSATNCHVDKIYQPSRDELVFLLRKKGFVKKLLITVKSGSARVQFTENKYENPASPPMFCMLMRKYLSSARLLEIKQPNLERVIVFVFSSSNEMGDIVEIRLVCELIGNNANIILVNEKGKIIDSLKHSDIEKSSRLILPNATYSYPENQNKSNPLNTDLDIIIKKAKTSSLLSVTDGFSPLICREVENSPNTKTTLENIINDLKNNIKPILVLTPDNEPFDFSYTEILQYGKLYKNKTLPSFSALLDEFYTKKETIARINSNAKDIIKLVNNLKTRTEKKLSLRLQDLKKCENREELRIFGELIKANLYTIKNGSSFAEVPNYYDETMKTVRIPLNPSLSPSANANKYFKDYKKTYTAEQTLKKLTAKDREELIYFDSVLDSISRCSSLSELTDIREELTDAGYINSSSRSKKSKSAPHSFKEYISTEGYKILVGKNNRQNDYLTTSLASKNDLWFHAKNIPGSHVIVLCNGKTVSDETILQAANLAAKNSKASNSSNVAVDYTYVKYVKKPNGAKPGMVIYTTNKTIFVTPKGEY